MAGLLATLGGNPFNTPVGQKIEQATDASFQAENWALNMEICDIINDTDEGPKDAVRAIRKRLQQNMGKNYTVVLYTLTVLETCVKNCGRRFHLLISQKDFALDLVKLIGPKNDPPLAIQDRVLSLIQSWADAFHSNPEMQGVVYVYQDLKQKGIEFPMTDLDSMAPIITPQRTAVPSSSPNEHPPQPPEPRLPPPRTNAPSRPVESCGVSAALPRSSGLKEEQMVKLKSELDIVQGNMKVFGEMLTEMSPGNEHPEDLQLLTDLYKTLSEMQNRMVALIDRIGNEQITSELLLMNDDMNNLFLRYERYSKKQRAVQFVPEAKSPEGAAAAPLAEQVPDKLLIDFGESGEMEGVASNLQQLDIASGGGDQAFSASKKTSAKEAPSSASDIADEFDMFAQSRNMSYESSKTRGSSYADNTNLDNLQEGLGYYAQNRGQLQLDEDGAKNVSEWLNNKPAAKNGAEKNMPDTDFGKFLAERAAAAERLPDLMAVNSRPVIPQVPPPQLSRRQLEKDDAESALFTL